MSAAEESEKLPFREILDIFSVAELGQALAQANLPTAGSKAEKVDRLCTELQLPHEEFFDLFTAEALRIVCDSLDAPTGRKSDMIGHLVVRIASGEVSIEGSTGNPTFHTSRRRRCQFAGGGDSRGFRNV